MATKSTDTPVLPRPVEPLPEYAHMAARKALADRLVESFKLSRVAAMAHANAVVDPTAVRKSIGGDAEPVAERIAVPGGTILGIRTHVWARKVMPDPRNPRTLPARKHPFAVAPGTGKENSKFRPVPEPRTPSGIPPASAELAVEIENRHHLVWASQNAAEYVRANNDWSESIRYQGVMEAVWLVATSYRHGDGTDAASVPVTAEGSSRVTATHDNLGVRSADVPYDDGDGKFRAHLRRLNEALRTGTASPEDLVALRCERIPALLILGFVPHTGSPVGFPTALKSLVALRHVDPPEPWGEGPENESLADEVLDELERRNLITPTAAAYYAGFLTKEEARAAHLPADPTLRAAQIVRLFSNPDVHMREAIRVAVTSQSTRKNINQGLLNALATALTLRAVDDDPARVDQIRRYLRRAYSKAVHSNDWDVTGRDTETLVDDALAELRAAAAAGETDDPGPAALELSVRSAFPLVAEGRLSGDRGTRGNEQPDRRLPGEVLDAMRQTNRGILQLGQALRDHAEGRPIRAVSESGEIEEAEGGQPVIITDTYLRGEYPAAGKRASFRPGDTPSDRFRNALSTFAVAVDELLSAFEVIGYIDGDDGRPLVEAKGVDGRDCTAWRATLRQIDEELVVWARTHRRINGLVARPLAERTAKLQGTDDGVDIEDEIDDIDIADIGELEVEDITEDEEAQVAD